MTTPTQDLCERLSHVEGMRRIGPLIAEARATIEAQAEHIQKQALEYISLFDQCSDAQDRVKELEGKCALLTQSLEQEKTRCAALEAGLTDGVTDDMAMLQSRVEELEAKLRERGEPVAWQVRMVPEHLWTFTERPDDYRKQGWEARPVYAHPPAAAASEEDRRDAERWRYAEPRLTWASQRDIYGNERKRLVTFGVELSLGLSMRLPTKAEWLEALDAQIAAQKERGE